MDIEKVFDSLNPSFILAVLKKMVLVQVLLLTGFRPF